MTTLEKYHSIQANPDYFEENNIVAIKLKRKEITNYDEYIRACKDAGCISYNEERFTSHLNGE